MSYRRPGAVLFSVSSVAAMKKLNGFVQSGFSLLEIILVLVVFAVLGAAVTKLFFVVDNSRKTRVVVDTVKTIFSAGQRYIDSGYVFSNAQVDYDYVFDFKTNGFLPSDFPSGVKYNPWSGSITVLRVGAQNTTQMQAVFTNIPSDVCLGNIKKTLEGSYSAMIQQVLCAQSGSTTMNVFFQDYRSTNNSSF